MLPFRARGQRGITLIEIMLYCVIIVAAAVAVFVFSKKASVTAAVETEQRQIENIVKTVDGLFATQPNFAALGTNGAVYLRERAARAGLKYGTNAAGEPALLTGLGEGSGTLTLSVQSLTMASGPSAPNNSYRLAYNSLTRNECVRLVTASYPVATRVRVSHDVDDASGVQLAARGHLSVSPAEIAENCAGSDRPSVFLYFVPARAISGAITPTAPPAARCNPVHETQQAICPAGQVGAITQERDGTCTGPGNSMVYTVWTTTDDTCQDPPVAPPTVTPPITPDDCATNTYTQVLACPAGQVGQVVQTRVHDTCAGTMTPWATLSSSCQPPPPPATCTPGADTQIVACPAGQGGQINQVRSSTCASPTAVPTWGSWTTTSNTCTASCSGGGSSCCTVQRQTQPGPVCPAGTYGTAGEQERFLGCVNAQTQAASWTAWQDMTSGTCTACPATTAETQTQWVPRTGTCPSGQSGSITYEAEQVRTRDVSYSCPAGTSALPAPSYTTWASWADTGSRRNTVNTCTSTSGCSTDTNFYSSLLDANDPALDPAGTVTSCGNVAAWHASCSAGDVCSVDDRPGSGGSGWKSTSSWDMVCTGTCKASTGCGWDTTNSYYNPLGLGYPTFWRYNYVSTSISADMYCLRDSTGFSCSGSGPGFNINSHYADSSQVAALLPADWKWMAYNESAPEDALAANQGAEFTFDFQVDGSHTGSGTWNRNASCPSIVSCSIAAGTTFNWTVGSNSCTFTQPAFTAIATGDNFPVTDSTAPATGAAAFACSATGVLATTPNAGATCTAPVASCFTPAATNPALLTGVWRVGLSTPAAGGPGGGWFWNDGVGFRGAIQNDAARVTEYMNAIGLGGSASFQKCIPSLFGELTVFNGVLPNRGGNQADAARTTWTGWNNVNFMNYLGNSTNISNSSWTEIWLPRLAHPSLRCVPGEMIITRSSSNGFGTSIHAMLECVAAPTQCSVPAGTTFNWVVGGNSCTFTQASATTLSAGTNFGVTDSTAPATGAAAFACSAMGVLATTPNAGATCNASACTPPSGPLNGVWVAQLPSSQINPYAGAPGNIETNIGDLTRRNATAAALGGYSTWTTPGWMGVGCYNTSNGGTGTGARPIAPPSGACIVGERIASRVRGPSSSVTGAGYILGETFFYTCQN